MWILLFVLSAEKDASLALASKRYQEACDLYAKALTETPTKATLWLSRAECLVRLGQRTDAIAANQRAILHGDEASRLTAYMNLWKLNQKLEPTAGCERVTPSAACGNELWVCKTRVQDDSPTSTFSAEGLSFAKTEQLALTRAKTQSARPPQFDVSLGSHAETFCWQECQRVFDWCKHGRDALQHKTEACQKACKDLPCAYACFPNVCKQMQRTDERDYLINEAQFKDEYMSDCKNCDAGDEVDLGLSECDITSINACTQTIGLVCGKRPRELRIP